MLKYTGGKGRELERLMIYFPSRYDRYIEPFFGGGAAFFALAPEKAWINDLNEPLMRFYEDATQESKRLIEELKRIKECYESGLEDNERSYYRYRDMFNGFVPIKGMLYGTVYYYINRTAYSGLMRYNKNGEFNVPFGHYKKFCIEGVTEGHSALLCKAKRTALDFAEVLRCTEPDDFVFLDPPYDLAFSNYCPKDCFKETDHRRLAASFHALPCRAVMVVKDTPLMRELYEKDIAEVYDKQYSINIRNRIHSSAKHLVLVHER